MCGIGGILRAWPAGTTPPPPHESIPEAWLDTIDEAIKHRGPDGQGRFRDRAVRPDGSVVDVALVHRRLAIIDPACGQQPMVSERGRSGAEGLVAVVFNGCIYNHRELRRELEGLGHRFVTDHSDTEVLIHGWREWQDGMLSRLTFMGALLIWERASGRLVAMRSAPGEKPLYRVSAPDLDVEAYASVAGAISRLDVGSPWFRFPSDATRVRKWFAFGHDPAQTPTAASQVPYGVAYPQPLDQLDSIAGNLPAPSTHVVAEPLEAVVDRLLAHAVAQRLEADVPVACLLSGGIDSSLVASYAARAAHRFRTICIRMDDPRYDESSHARAVADHLGTEHIEAATSPNAAHDLVHLITLCGLPFGDSSLLPTYWACKAAGSHAKVLLTGDGGDELFYGYERYQVAGLTRRLSWLAPAVPTSLLPQRDPKSAFTKLARLIEAARVRSYSVLLAIFPPRDLDRLLGREPLSFGWVESGGTAKAARDHDLQWHLGSDMLRKVDIASMSVPVETRAPFLDQHFISTFRSLTPAQAMPHGQRKGLLRALARKYLPAEIVDRPKQGFAIPIGEWFRSDYGQMRTLLMDHLNAADPWPDVGIELNRRFVQQMVDEHMGHKRDHSQRLYMLLVLSIWARNCLK